MRDLRKATRPLIRLVTTLVAVAMLWLPAAAQADDTVTDLDPSTTTVLPLLGSNLTIEIVTDADGAVTSVSVDGQVVDFEQEDDEISFLYTVDGQTITITVEFEDEDDDEGDLDDDSDEDDDEGDLDDDSDEDEDDDEGDLDDDSDEDEDDDE